MPFHSRASRKLLRSWVPGAAALSLAACSGSDTPPPTDTTTPTTSTTPTTTDTGWPGGDVGSFQIDYSVNTGQVGVYGLAAVSPPAYVNLAQCGIAGTVCLPAFPSKEDDFLPFDPDLDLDKDTLTTRYLGYELTFGPYTLDYREDADNPLGFGYYFANGTDVEYPEGWIGLSWGGQWPEYAGTEDLYVPRPIELLNPQMNGFLQFTNGEDAVIEWVPTGDGIVTLAVVPEFSDGTYYWLEDDGYAAIHADDLALTGDVEDLSFVLSRWSVSELSRFGHLVDVQATSNVVFTGQLINIGGRDEIQPSPECAEAQGSLPLEPGSYWGLLKPSLGDDLDPNNGCITGTYADATGVDGLYKLHVESHHQVSVDYNLFTESASVYFVSDCGDEDTCFTGSDLYPDPNVHEFISYFNPSDEATDIYLVVDETDGGEESVLTLDVTDLELDAPVMYDTCAEAETAAPLTSGSYSFYADFLAFTGQLNPGVGGCTDTSLPGPDMMLPVELQSGETVSASVDMSAADAAIYLLYNCNDAFSCAAGSDSSLSDPEGVFHTNSGNYPQTVYLVIDSKLGLAPYFLSVNIY